MKTALTLTQLAQEIDRQRESKRDFVAPEKALAMAIVDDSPIDLPEPALLLPEQGHFHLNNHAHGQLASHLNIPKPYYDRMREQSPDLLVSNVNHWLTQSTGKRMVRTLDGQTRAYLSDRYRPLDNTDLAEAILPVLMEDPRLEIASCALTETRLYLKVTTPRMQRDVKVGDTVQAGLVISNSEVGAGGVKVEPLLLRLICLNGAVINEAAMKKHHLGGRLSEEDRTQEFFRDETRRLDDAAFFAKVQDVVRGMWTDQELFGRIVERWADATAQPIEGRIEKVVEVTGRHLGLNEPERDGVLRHLIDGGDLSRYGLANAVTRLSQDLDDYDRATDLERLGSRVIELPHTQWKELAGAQ